MAIGVKQKGIISPFFLVYNYIDPLLDRSRMSGLAVC